MLLYVCDQLTLFTQRSYRKYTGSQIMKGIARIYVLIQLGILICFTGVAQQPGKTLRVFLIGNSFSQNATRYLPQLAKEGGHSIEFGRAEIGGCPLQRHWDSVEVNLRDSSRGKAYGGKSLKE